jgi:hypothetical protein
MTFLITYAFLRTLTLGNHCACLVEAELRENASPFGKIEPDTTQGRADVGDVPTAETLGAGPPKRARSEGA